MDALAEEMAAGFSERMAEYLRTAFPEWSAGMGVRELRSFVKHGVARATEYGFGTELDAARYILAMRELGMRFDEDPAMPWAGDLLRRPMPPGERAGRLEDAVWYEREARRIRNAS